MHRILVLWATPRSTSTEFEWMMRPRGDLTCFHEPFGEAWYKGEDVSWKDGGYWHAKLRASDGLEPQPQPPSTFSSRLTESD